MNYKKLLEGKFRLFENVDFTLTPTGYLPIAKTRSISHIIHHPLIPASYDPRGLQVSAAVPEVIGVSAQPEKWIKEGMTDVFVDPLDITWTYVPAIQGVVGSPAVPAVYDINQQGALLSAEIPAWDEPVLINHPAIPMVLNAQGGVISQEIPAWSEPAYINENYYEVFPTEIVLRQTHGSIIREACRNAISIIMSFNAALTINQVTLIATDFAVIYQHLKDFRPGAALALINAVPVDGILIKQELKDMLVATLTE